MELAAFSLQGKQILSSSVCGNDSVTAAIVFPMNWICNMMCNAGVYCTEPQKACVVKVGCTIVHSHRSLVWSQSAVTNSQIKELVSVCLHYFNLLQCPNRHYTLNLRHNAPTSQLSFKKFVHHTELCTHKPSRETQEFFLIFLNQSWLSLWMSIFFEWRSWQHCCHGRWGA